MRNNISIQSLPTFSIPLQTWCCVTMVHHLDTWCPWQWHDSPQSPFLLTDLSHWLTYLTRNEAVIIADHDVPQLDDGVEGGGHHHITVLLASVEHLGIEDHLTYHLRQTPQEMPARRVFHPVSHKHTSYIELLQWHISHPHFGILLRKITESTNYMYLRLSDIHFTRWMYSYINDVLFLTTARLSK